eukprot:jgi/Picre1/33578/NNA_008898.t1
MGGLGCLPLKEHLHARDLKWVTQLFTMGTSKLWVQLVWNIFLCKYTNVDQDALEAVAHLPTPLRALITHVHGDETIIPSAAADSLTWIRTLWHKLFTEYQIKQSGVAPQTLTAALPCLQPPEVQSQWQRRGETIPLEDYTVKFGTLLLTEGQQADRNYRWKHGWKSSKINGCQILRSACSSTPSDGAPLSCITAPLAASNSLSL